MLTSEPPRLVAGRYRLETTVDQGVHTIVYGATDLRLRRQVTVKMLRSEWAADPELSDRFKVDARTLAGLSHPNVVAIHDTGEEDGVAYMVTEPLPGTTLADELGAGPLSEIRATEIGRQVLAALAAAHAVGIFHGDLQPANLFTFPHGAVKLADFAGPTPAGSALVASRGAGPTGALAHLSRERLDRQPASPAGDVYGAGAVLYECLVGRPPFASGPTAALVAAVQGGGPVPVRALRPAVEPVLAAVIERALDPHPDRRFDSAVAMSGALLSRPVYVTATHPVPAAGRTVAAAPRAAVRVSLRHPVPAEPARAGPEERSRHPVPAEATRHVLTAPLPLPAASVSGPARPGGEEAAPAAGGAGDPPRSSTRSPSPPRVLPKAMQRIEGHLVLVTVLAGLVVMGGLLIASLVGTRPSTRLNSHSAVGHGTRPATSAPAGKSAAPSTTQPPLGAGSLPLGPASHGTVPSRSKTSAVRLASASPRSGAGTSHHAPTGRQRAAARQRHRPPARRQHRLPAHHRRPSRRKGHSHAQSSRYQEHRRRHHPHHNRRHRYFFFYFFLLVRRLF